MTVMTVKELKVPKSFQREKRLLVSTFPDQKENIRIKKPDGTYAKLFRRFKEWTLDGWESNPTLGRALTDCDEIKVGDYILTSHNAFQNAGTQIAGYDYESNSDIELEDGEEVFSLPKSACWVGIRGDEEMFCIGPSLICKRVYEPSMFSAEDKAIMESFEGSIASKTEFADIRLQMDVRKKYDKFVLVEKMPENPSLYFTWDKEISMTEISIGDIIAVYKLSDVEHKYMWNNEPRSIIRVNFERDFLGVKTEGLKYEL